MFLPKSRKVSSRHNAQGVGFEEAAAIRAVVN
jgi:hypothetical protein